MEFDDYIVERPLGKGSCGTAYKARRKSDGLLCTIKEIDARHMTEEEKEDAKEEIRLLATVRNKNMVSYYDAFSDDDRLYVIMETCNRGDFAGKIKLRAEQRKYFREAQIWSFFIQMLRGLVALHSKGLIHRNVASGNVIQLDSHAIKLGDVQVGKVKEGAPSSEIGNPHYIAPEVWENKPYTFKSDVWALGCIFYEMITLTLPFGGCSLPDLRLKATGAMYRPIPSTFSFGLSKVLKLLLNPDESCRISAEDMLRHPLLQAQLHHAPAADSLPRVRPTGKADVRKLGNAQRPSRLPPRTSVAEPPGAEPKEISAGVKANLQVAMTPCQKENSPAISTCKKSTPIPAPRAILSSPDNDAKLSSLSGSTKPASKVRVPRVAMLGNSATPLAKNGAAEPVKQRHPNPKVNLKHFKTAYIEAPKIGGDESRLSVNPNDHDRSDASRNARPEGIQSKPGVLRRSYSSSSASVRFSRFNFLRDQML